MTGGTGFESPPGAAGTPWETVDHTECEAEPIHKPNALQAHAWLIAFDLGSGRVTHVSANLIEPIAEVLGPEVVLESTLARVASALKLPEAVNRFEAVDSWPAEMPWLHPDPVLVTCHSTSDYYVVEIERDLPPLASNPGPMIATLLSASDWQAFAEEAVAALGRAFGYARTMAYKIHADGHGEVIAEHLNEPGLQPYLGLHYPAADIPPQARRLYVLQLVRAIEYIDGATVPILSSTPGDAPDLDLSLSRYRAVSPVHLQYMRNMGSYASAGVSIVHSGRLAGMFVMHHSEARALSGGDRAALVTVSRLASFVAATMDERAFSARRTAVTALAESLRRALIAGDDPVAAVEAIADEALTLVEADGLVARIGNDMFARGDVPDPEAIDRRVREMSSGGTNFIQVTDRLALDIPALACDECAGAIVARVPGNVEVYLAWFRRPFRTILRWGGEPADLVRKDSFGRLYPRSSFDEFVENVTNRGKPWTEHDRIAADAVYHALQAGLLEHSYRQLAVEATVDPLTRLGNRRALVMSIENRELKRRVGDSHCSVSLLFLDLDRFKQINDVFGHEKGDLVLRVVANRIELATSDLAGTTGEAFRLGGDEFVVLLCNATSDEVAQLADRILRDLEDPMTVGGVVHSVRASIGSVVVDDAEAEAGELLRRGDLAMYSAKRAGGARVMSYQEEFSHAAIHRLSLEKQLSDLLDGSELVPAYQPVLSLITGRFIGAEALARRHLPDGDLVSIGDLIQLAEETGQIATLDRHIARLAVERCLGLLRDTSVDFHLSFNASVETLNESYCEFLRELVDRHAIPEGRLIVEVTESAMVRESGRMAKLLAAVRSSGVLVAIDDFGTGYSSLGLLETLPADIVKLDQSFVQRLHGKAGDDVFARWAIQLVSELGMRMVAEGVETLEQEDALRSLGYDWVQGYRFGRPASEPPGMSRD